MQRIILWGVVLAGLMPAVRPATGQVLKKKFEAKVEEKLSQLLGPKLDEVRKALRGLALYPQETRQAILELARRPDLVVALRDPGKRRPEALKQLLSNHSPQTVKAVLPLADEPAILQTLAQYPALMKLVGEIHARHKGYIDQQLEGLSTEVAQTQTKSADEWARRLEENGAALQELIRALTAYAEQITANAAEEGQTAFSATEDPYGTGAYYTAAGGAFVYAVPSGAFAAYVVRNADTYAELAGEMVEQWLWSENLDDFEDAVGNWWDNWQPVLSEQFLQGDAARATRLKELAALDKEAARQAKDRIPSATERRQLVQERGGSQLRDSLRPNTAGSKPTQLQPRAKSSRPSGGPKPSVSRQAPTQRQQAARGNSLHRGSWGAPGGAGRGRAKPSGGRRR